MTAYCALLRGIGPGNPNMRNDKLRGVFEDLGFEQVGSVLSSGNIVFACETTAPAPLETRIQEGLNSELGIPGGTIVRSRDEIVSLVETEPFGDLEHGRSSYLTATFLKHAPDRSLDPVPQPDHPAMKVLAYNPEARALLAVTDTTGAKTPDYMGWVESQFGTEITTRTWLTVQRILAKLPDA